MARTPRAIGPVAFVASPGAARTVARKNMDMDVAKLATARRLLGTDSDTETVDLALDLVAFHGEVFAALDRLAAAGGLADAFDDVPRETGSASRRRRTSGR